MTKLKGLIWVLGGATLPAKIFGFWTVRPTISTDKSAIHAEKMPSKDRTKQSTVN